MPLKKEDLIHKGFAKIVAEYEAFNLLKCNWRSYNASGEYRNKVTGGLLKAKGLIGGHSDYVFYHERGGICHNLFIEFKADNGRQSPNQVTFERAFLRCKNVNYHLAYSVEEGIKLLEKYKIIT